MKSKRTHPAAHLSSLRSRRRHQSGEWRGRLRASPQGGGHGWSAGITSRRRDRQATCGAAHNELEKWRVAGEEAQNALDDLGDDAQEEELAALQEAYLHCYSKHEEIAWQIERLEHPENHT
jgi:hypothetical protein